MYARVCQVFAKFVYTVMRVVDSWVPLYGAQRQSDMRWVAQQRDSCWQFFFQFYEHLAIQASEEQCGKYLVFRASEWVLSHSPHDVLMLIDNPAARVARFVDALSLNAACLATDAWDNYIKCGLIKEKQIPLGISQSTVPGESQLCQTLSGFFHHFTVNQDNGDLTSCISSSQPEFVHSQFRVCLVDDYGSLLNLLYQLSKLKHMSNTDPSYLAAVAVDLEGLRLCRHGPIALAQLCLSSDLHTTYVIDITRLGYHAFNTCTFDGVSIRRVFEDPVIRKCFYDPRNDCDALYHQFSIAPDLRFCRCTLKSQQRLQVLSWRFEFHSPPCFSIPAHTIKENSLMGLERGRNSNRFPMSFPVSTKLPALVERTHTETFPIRRRLKLASNELSMIAFLSIEKSGVPFGELGNHDRWDVPRYPCNAPSACEEHQPRSRSSREEKCL